MSNKSVFVKYLGDVFVNSLGLALYSSGSVRIERAGTGKSLGVMKFDGVEAAGEWFCSHEGNNAQRVNAICNNYLFGEDQNA